MNPTWHLQDDMLLAFAAGTLPEAEALIVGCHLTLCPQCRAVLASSEDVGALLWAQSLPSEPANVEVALANVLARLDEKEPSTTPSAGDGVLPGPLADLIGPVAALRFTWVFPGVRQVEIPVPTSGMPLRLFQLHPDMRVPDHTHRGRELSLVLSGGFRDDSGHFVRGDICERHQERHRQHIDPGEPCLVLVLADAPLVPYTLRGWLAGVLRKV